MRHALYAGILGALISMSNLCNAQSDTTITYQGELSENGQPAGGLFNMDFLLWDSASGGLQVGPTVMINGVNVSEGKFTAELNFGASVWDNSARWLEIEVNGITLNPRHAISNSPYAIQTRGFYVADNGRVSVGKGAPVADFHFQGINDAYPEIRLGQPQGQYSTIDENVGHLSIEKYADGESAIELNPISGFNTARKYVDFFKRTTAIGSESGAFVRFYRADGSSDISALISARDGFGPGDSYFQAFGGNFGIGTSTPGNTLDVAGDGMIRNRLGVGNPSSLFGQLTITDSGDGAVMAISADSTNSVFPTIFAANTAGGPGLWALGTSDTSLAGGGLIVAGAETGSNVSIDQNEIMARNAGAPADLFLNAEGGQVTMGQYGMHPAFAYGSVDKDGNTLSASPNITAIHRHFEGQYDIHIVGGAQSTDIVIVSALRVGFFAPNRLATAGILDGVIDVRLVYPFDDDPLATADGGFAFVIYRP